MKLEIALKEEIGTPDLFVGRQKELTFFLQWLEKVRGEFGRSTAVLARRRKGKTALLQRLFNIIYTRNDPQLVPFYFRIPEKRTDLLDFSDLLYRSLLSFYFAFVERQPEFLTEPLEMKRLKSLAQGDRILSSDIDTMETYLAQGRKDICWD